MREIYREGKRTKKQSDPKKTEFAFRRTMARKEVLATRLPRPRDAHAHGHTFSFNRMLRGKKTTEAERTKKRVRAKKSES